MPQGKSQEPRGAAAGVFTVKRCGVAHAFCSQCSGETSEKISKSMKEYYATLPPSCHNCGSCDTCLGLIAPDGMKICRKCGETKPLTEFYKNGGRGYQGSCKTCYNGNPIKRYCLNCGVVIRSKRREYCKECYRVLKNTLGLKPLSETKKEKIHKEVLNKLCMKCCEVKPVSEFTSDITGLVFRNTCINCSEIKKEDTVITCGFCGTIFIKANNSRYCSKECAKNAQSVENKNRLSTQRLLVLQHYSNSMVPFCNCCNENIFSCLALDHIDNNGAEHRKEIGTTIYFWIITNGFPSGYQVLCSNCNFAKYRNGGICPHQQQKEEV